MHVLFIEDNPRDVELARIALERSGLPVGFAAVPDEEAATAYLLCRGGYAGREPEPPAVIFLDLALHQARGSDLIATIRSHPGLAWLPIVMLTTSHSRADVAECYRRGANAYTIKPVSFAEYVVQLRQAVQFWVGVNVNISSADG